jgi:hypothetical protein
MATRLEALEGKIPECESIRVDLGALVSELAALNSNFKALTEAMVTTLKRTQENTQYQSKADGDKTRASSTPNAQTGKASPSASHSPSTKHNGSKKGNGSGPEALERTRSNTRAQSGTQSKDILLAPSPPNLDFNVHAPVPIVVRLSSADEDATTIDETADGSISPSTGGAFVPPPAKAIVVGTTSKKRLSSHARGKGIPIHTASDIENDALKKSGMTLPIATSTKVISEHYASLPLYKCLSRLLCLPIEYFPAQI